MPRAIYLKDSPLFRQTQAPSGRKGLTLLVLNRKLNITAAASLHQQGSQRLIPRFRRAQSARVG